MVSVILIAAIALPLYWAFTKYTALQKNIAAAKRSGLPYFIAPVFVYEAFWLITAGIWVPLFKKLPWAGDWVDFITPDWVWIYLYDPFEKHGDTFLVVSPGRTVIWTASAEAIHQMTSHRDLFPKPLENYKLLDLYGRNVVTTEGMDWRMHRKAAASGFNEKNNALVFEESISQTHGMLKQWLGPDGTGKDTLKEVPLDTMRVTLYIISRVGFGVRLFWPGENVEKDDQQPGSNFGSHDTPKGFTLSFESALTILLDRIILVMILPQFILKYLPIKAANESLEAFENWGKYMKAIFDQRVEETKSGQHGDGMDIMGSLVQGLKSDAKPNGNSNGSENGQVGLTESNVMGNSFVMLLAGHETTANTIHFALVELAANPSSQRRLQKDVDSIFGKTPTSEWDYDRDISKCLGSMMGAVLYEQLRIMPPVVCIPKAVHKTQDQTIILEGKKVILPADAFININAVGVQRNPKYWPSRGPSKISGAPNDLNDFYPERWLAKDQDSGDSTSHDTAPQLFKPEPGSYVPFSEGPRSCLGKRIAQIEVVAILAVIFQTYSVELAVDEWATDDEVDQMTIQERRVLYQKAQAKSRETIRTATTKITLKLNDGDAHVPLRLVKRGDERFVNVIN